LSSIKLFGSVLVLVLFISGMALAGEKCCEMQIYGRAHLSLDMMNDGNPDSDAAVSGLFVSSNSSRIGFKGHYGLEKDMVAFWQYECDADPTNGNVWSTRNSFAGVKGNFGKFLLGRHDTPLKIIGRKVDLFHERLGDTRTFTMNDARENNVVVYGSPLLGESTKILVGFVPDEGGTDNTILSACAMYKKDNIFAAAAFETRGEGLFAGPTTPESQSQIRASGAYKGEGFKVAALFDNVSNHDGFKDYKVTVMGGGVAYDINEKYTGKVQIYMISKDDGDDATTWDDDAGSTMMAFGVDKKCAKNVTMYVVYAMCSNQDNANYGPWGGGHDADNPGTAFVGETGTGAGIGTIITW